MSHRNHGAGEPYHLLALRVRQATGKLVGLTPKQQQAIGLLLGGCAQVDVAHRLVHCHTSNLG